MASSYSPPATQALRRSNYPPRHLIRSSAAPGLPDVDFHSLRHSSNSFLIEEGADPLLIARRNGRSSTPMVLDRYGRHFEGARRQAAKAMDRVFAGVEIVVKWSSKFRIAATNKNADLKNLVKSAFDVAGDVVEMRRLELLTPYMRSKCSTS